MSMRNMRIALCLAGAVAVTALGACREEEQGRLRNFDPGVYKGQEDTPLDSAVIDDLRERARRQAGS